MKHPDSASFLQGIAKRARKYYLGVTTLTQDIEDFLSSDYGKSILSNSSIQVLLKQNSSEVETLAKTLFLSEGEKQFLVTAQVGEGLLFAGQNHITAQFVASTYEYDLITSKPQDILRQDANAPTPSPEVNTPSEPQTDSGIKVVENVKPLQTQTTTAQPQAGAGPTPQQPQDPINPPQQNG